MATGTNWTYQGKIVKELPKDCEAFVYLITNLLNHKKYRKEVSKIQNYKEAT